MIEVSYEGDVRKQSVEERGFTSQRSPLKTRLGATPAHYGLLSHTFSSDPSANQTLFTIPHGFNYAPAAIVGIKDFFNNEFSIGYKGIGAAEWITYYTDATNLVIHYKYNSSGHVNVSGRRYDFRYFIFVEDAR